MDGRLRDDPLVRSTVILGFMLEESAHHHRDSVSRSSLRVTRRLHATGSQMQHFVHASADEIRDHDEAGGVEHAR